MKLAFITACGDDSVCTEILCELNREPARSSCCAVDEHRFSTSQVSTFYQSGPGRHAGIGNSGCRNVVEAVWNCYAVLGAHERLLCERPTFGA